MSKQIFTLVVITVLTVAQSDAQHRRGVTDNDFSTIQTGVENIFGAGKYEIIDVMNVDSTKEPGASEGIEDPYGTLTRCYVFVAFGKTPADPNQEHPRGFIGIVRNSQIIWRSDTLINDSWAVEAGIEDIRDLNRDGRVDIVTIWQEGNRGDRAYVWIFSWDGHIGSVISDIGSDHRSAIVSVVDKLHILDLNGDGIKEITGRWKGDVDPTAYVSVTYSWNGHLYGKWPNPPHPPPSGIPKNQADIMVKATVIRDNGGSFTFSYLVENKQTSLQKLESFLVLRKTDSISTHVTRSAWESLIRRRVPSVLWVDLSETNLIFQGDRDSSFRLQTPALPTITTYYAQGWNGATDLAGIFTNSVQGKTLGPADPPDPFVCLSFLDTLLSYTRQSAQLGWLGRIRDDDCDDDERPDDGVVRNIENRLQKARRELVRGDSVKARRELEKLIRKVDRLQRRGERVMTSEAYALLKYNTEYLIERLPERRRR